MKTGDEVLDTFIVFLQYLLFIRISFYVTYEVSQLSGVTDFPVKLVLSKFNSIN